jgi:hypothetical protein
MFRLTPAWLRLPALSSASPERGLKKSKFVILNEVKDLFYNMQSS